MCAEIQGGVLHFVKHAGAISASAGIDPFIDLKVAASRAAAILARFLLLPTDDELLLLGGMKHDVNLGTQTLVPTADPLAAERLNIAYALPTFCAAPEPPMWLGGTATSFSPAHSFLYAMFAAGHLPGDIFGDVKCGSIDVKLMATDETQSFRFLAFALAWAKFVFAFLCCAPTARSRSQSRSRTSLRRASSRELRYRPARRSLMPCPIETSNFYRGPRETGSALCSPGLIIRSLKQSVTNC